MTRIAIVEDEAAVREQLAGYVQRYTRQYGTPFEVTEFADGMEILEDYRPQFDIIFLDVEMKHLDGMETARRIRERDGGVLIVFITNMAQYAIRGYAVGALDYVLKPVPYFAFSQQLQKALGQLEKRERHYLAVAVDGGMRRLDAAEIYYLESEGHKVHFYTEKEDFVVPGTLKTMRKSWWAGRLHGATAGIWSIWRRFPACSRIWCRLVRIRCRSAARGARPLWRGWRIILGVRANDDIAGYSPPVHRFGGSAGGAAVCAQAAAADGPARDLGRGSRLGGAAGGVFAGHGESSAGVVDPLHGNGDSFHAAVLWVTRSITLLEAGYVCARAFILAELAASVEWQLHCVLWPQRGGAEPLSLLLLAVVYGGIFTAMLFVENRRPGPAGKLKITPAGTFVAVVMALTAFAVSNLSFANGSEANMNMFYIRTLVDLAGVLI